MDSAAKYLNLVKSDMAASWLPELYRDQVLKSRTRSYQFPASSRNPNVEIHHTLLGIELKIGRKRMLCPDLATARYLSVFARLGCRAVAIPYDITRISFIADVLESSWHRMLLICDRLTMDRSTAFRTRIQRQIIGKVREEIETAGAGPRIPRFKQSTRQRIGLNGDH